MMQKFFGNRAKPDSEHWISVSDMMAGLMVIFLFIAISYWRPLSEFKKNTREIVVALQESQVEFRDKLYDEFQDDLHKWCAEVNPKTLSVRFTNGPCVFFKKSKAEIEPEFKDVLNDFFPRYLDILKSFKNSIAEVRIEGHTSSEWEGAKTKDEAYFRNMELSQARTRAVLEYCLKLRSVRPSKEWARDLITANGLSSSRPIFDKSGARENAVKSRRVEFRVRMDSEKQIFKILEIVSE